MTGTASRCAARAAARDSWRCGARQSAPNSGSRAGASGERQRIARCASHDCSSRRRRTPAAIDRRQRAAPPADCWVAKVSRARPARRAASITLTTDWCAAVASADTITTGSFCACGRGGQLGRQHLDAAAVDRLAVDRIAAVGRDRDDDLRRPVAQLLGVGDRQRELQLGELRVGRRQHQEDQDHQQHVDERDQVDLRLLVGVACGSSSRGALRPRCARHGEAHQVRHHAVGRLLHVDACSRRRRPRK